MRKICKDENRKKAFEDYYADLHNNHPLLNKCNVVLSMFVSCLDPNCYSNSYPDERVAHHCPNRPGSKNNGDDTLYTPDPNEANRAAEEALEKAVAKYAEDNLVVVRVGIICHFVTISCRQVFLKDPYYQKLTRAETMSTITFLGAAGGWLGLCCGLSIISVVCHLSF